MQQLGVLKRVDIRDLWPHEAANFTPWLAQHLADLSEVLGMELEHQVQEAPVGTFSLDLLATDLGRDRPVIIENQLEPTDHDHLGKLLTYAAGYDAGTVVWIAADFRDPHRQALEWLNQRTDQHTEFFGVVVEAIQIDDSRPAVNFRIISSPNDWRKAGISSTTSPPSQRAEAYQEFFQTLIDELRNQHQFTRARKGQPQNWYSFSSGINGIAYGAAFSLYDQVRAEVYIDRADRDWNKALFDAVHAEKSRLEQQFGEPLDWQRLDDRRASRIAIYRPGSIMDDSATLEEIKEWLIEHLLKLKRVVIPMIASRLSEAGVGPVQPTAAAPDKL